MVQISKIQYGGWPNCYKISNDHLDLIVTTDVGPRIIFFGFKNGENQFYVKTDEAGLTGGSEWHIFGGHRLWHAPEVAERTYAPDNHKVQVEQIIDGLRLTSQTEPCGIQKAIEIHLSETKSSVKVKHILINNGVWTVPLAAWALSVMRTGGVAIVPHAERIEFPQQLTPTHSITLWGYTRMSDSRWTWGERYIFLRQDETSTKPQKLGILNTHGWAGYLRDGNLFVKKFDYTPSANYSDINCNFETFTNDEMLELESLGPLQQLEPGKKVQHWEEWSLFSGVKTPSTDDEVDEYILPLLGN
ncbi:MAG: hypothetical protein C0401_11150 [Anaerolinea sp.]|nr:hypothetical protein [Anaerolinea sp.]